MKGKKHILFIVENNPAPPDRRVWAEALAAREFGYDVSIICPRDHKAGETRRVIEGVRIYRHPHFFEGIGKLGFLFEYLNALLWEILLAVWIYLRHPFHLIHAANPPDHIFLVAFPFKVLGVKYLFDHHDICPENYVAKFGTKGAFYNALMFMEKLTFKTADVVISTNESYRKVAMERGGMKDSEVFVVRNGPDLEKIPEVTPDHSLREGFTYLVGYVGIIGNQEGIENLIGSVKYMVEELKRTDIKFCIIGKGPNWKNVVKMTRKMGLEKYIQFLGYIPDDEMYRTLGSVDVCINPEFGNEFTDRSTMIKIMEYMTFEKPIVQYFTTEGQVSAGESAVYVHNNSEKEFADVLIALLEDEERRKRMGAIGRKRVEEKLSWQIQKGHLKKVYDTVFGTE